MTKLLDKPDELRLRRQFGIFDDFDAYTSGQRWASVSDAGATIAVDGDAVGGVLAVTSNGGDNDEAYVKTTAELYQFANDQPLRFETRIQFSEAATNAANLLVGIMSSSGADSLLDDGSGPKADYSGAVFYKADGGTTWNCESSLGTTQETSATSVTAGASSFYTLRIEFVPTTSTQGTLSFFIDDIQVASHDQSFVGATEMSIVLGVKSGTAQAETMNVDYVSCQQLRKLS